MSTPRPPISDWVLERYAAGDLGEAEQAELRRRCQLEPDLGQRLQELVASDREILARYPSRVVAAQVRSRAEERRPGGVRSLSWGLLPAAAAAAAVVLFVLGSDLSNHTGPLERSKGFAPYLSAYRLRDGRAESLRDGDRVRAGEIVQLHFGSAGRPFGAVVSIDGQGQVTLHWPEEPSRPARIEGAGEVALPHGFELDGAPGFERFLLVTSRDPIDLERLLQAARQLAASPQAPTGRLQLPTGWEQVSLRLSKEVQP